MANGGGGLEYRVDRAELCPNTGCPSGNGEVPWQHPAGGGVL
jgi:hypothetical protein